MAKKTVRSRAANPASESQISPPDAADAGFTNESAGTGDRPSRSGRRSPRNRSTAGNEGSASDGQHLEENRNTEPRQSEPRPTKSRQSQPRQSESRQSEPRQSEPRQSEPRQSESRQSESRQSESRQSEPRQPESRHSEPRQTESRYENSSESQPRNDEHYHEPRSPRPTSNDQHSDQQGQPSHGQSGQGQSNPGQNNPGQNYAGRSNSGTGGNRSNRRRRSNNNNNSNNSGGTNNSNQSNNNFSSGGGGGRANNGPRNSNQRGNNKSRRPNKGPNQNQSQHQHQNRNNPEPLEFDDAELVEGMGVLEMHPNGYGFLRHPDNNYTRERSDPFVPGTMIEKFGLRAGVKLRGMVQPARRQQGPRLRELFDVDGVTPEQYLEIRNFDDLTPINPVFWYKLETGPAPLTTRVMDLLTPLGKGQRALIVSPPRAGKTIMLQHIANGIAENYPNTKLVVLLIDERPEEVTDMKRNVRGEVIASSLDEDVESHVRLSQMVIARCKRLAEMGQDVFLLMDSITRLARAFNKWVGNTGRTMSGGVDIKAMDIPKKLFSSARAFEEGGSLTIVGTALVDTGSRMDELIFQEFKGTGNMELVLDRKLADRRVWPAIDISQSGTRREELLLHPDTLQAVTMLRRTLTTMHHIEAMEQLTKQLTRFKTNAEFIKLISGKMGEL